MNSSSVRYLVSLMLVICVMLSPNIGACAESVESEPEMEELCVMVKDSWFAHLAFELDGENTSNEWLESVSESDYNNL